MKCKFLYWSILSAYLVACLACSNAKRISKSKESSDFDKSNDTTDLDLDIAGLSFDTLKVTSINTAEEVTDVYFDDYTIDLNKLDHAKFLKKDNTISIANLKIPSAANKDNIKSDTTIGYLSSSNLFFNKLRVIHENDTFYFEGVRVVGAGVKNWAAEDVINDFDPSAESKKIILDYTGDMDKRLQALKIKVDNTLKKEADHAAQLLPEELKNYEKTINKIKLFYQSLKTPAPASTLKVDLDSLKSLKISLTRIENELIDAKNNPINLSNSFFFELGEFEISNKSMNSVFNGYIEQVKASVLSLVKDHPEREVKIFLVVTGYADDIEVKKEETKEKLLKIQPSCDELEYLEEFDNCLNNVLSQKRAENIGKFLIERIKSEIKLQKVVFVSEFIGNGKQYPPNYEGNCKGDCFERRIARVSKLVVN